MKLMGYNQNVHHGFFFGIGKELKYEGVRVLSLSELAKGTHSSSFNVSK